MPPPPKNHPYRRNSENLAAIEKGLTQAERAHKHAIRSGHQAAIQFQARIHMFVVGMMAEARLRKILSDPAGFNDRERKLVMRNSQIDRWLTAVEYAFRRHYKVPIHLEVDDNSLGTTRAGQFEQLNALLRDDLDPIIQDRNKTAHAQWIWHLNNSRNRLHRPRARADELPSNHLSCTYYSAALRPNIRPSRE